MYARIKTTKPSTLSQLQMRLGITKPNYNWIHHPILPNYLKTFNFKLTNNILPLQAKYKQNVPSLNPYCYLCKEKYENDIHLFHKCIKIQPLLNNAALIFQKSTGQHTTCFHESIRIQFHTPLPSTTCHNDLTPYLNTLLSFTIWKTRNKCKNENIPNLPRYLIKILQNFLQNLNSRQKLYEKRDKKPYHEMINAIKTAITQHTFLPSSK